jgi:hypothetical protein
MDRFSTSEYKVTYWLGAGASAKALPTVKQTPHSAGLAQSMRDLANEMGLFIETNTELTKYRQMMIMDLIWLADGSDKFGTTDTYAKYLYLIDRESIHRLKRTLIYFFLTEQCIKESRDDRALIFLTTVMQTQNIFPTNINIIT